MFRTLLHSRLALGLQAYLRDDRFHGDIVVIEGRESDEQFFGVNPLAFWKREESVRHGFESVRRTLEDHADVLAPVLARYGLQLRTPGVAAEPAAPRETEEPLEESGSVTRLRAGAARPA